MDGMEGWIDVIEGMVWMRWYGLMEGCEGWMGGSRDGWMVWMVWMVWIDGCDGWYGMVWYGIFIGR